MERLIKGNVPDNILRLIGKLSPTGNGLMAILNVSAVAFDPTFLAVTAIGVTSKYLADKRSKQAIQNVRELLAPGTKKGKRFSDEEIISLGRSFCRILSWSRKRRTINDRIKCPEPQREQVVQASTLWLVF